MTSPTEIAATAYWFSCATLRRTQLSPVDQAMALDTIHQLAHHGTTRVRQIAARRLRPCVVGVDTATDTFIYDGDDCA